MTLSPEVRDGWCAFTARFEGLVPWAYRDEKGLVTVGLGCLIDPLSPEVLDLPWLAPSGSPAPRDYAAADWRRVKGMPAALPASAYRDLTGLHLAEDGIEHLALERLAADVAVLEEHFGDLSRLPVAVQWVLCSMSWALGAGFAPHWPKFTAAIAVGDWSTAADECAISTVGNAGVAPRNAATRALLLGLVSGAA